MVTQESWHRELEERRGVYWRRECRGGWVDLPAEDLAKKTSKLEAGIARKVAKAYDLI
jgi:hypothetical protein